MKTTTLTILAGALALGILTGGSVSAAGLAPAFAKHQSGITEVGYGKLSAWHIKRKLSHWGYRNVRVVDNHGRIYGFIAQKRHRLYKIQVNAYNGYVVSVNRVYTGRSHRSHRSHRRYGWY